jgi:hypothetical protein
MTIIGLNLVKLLMDKLLNNSYREMREEIQSLYPDAFKECRSGHSEE